MKKYNLLLRIITFSAGLFVMALGVALSVKADLGVSPVSCIPYVYCFKFPLTLGTLTIIFSLILILLQVMILRSNYRLVQLLQLPVVLTFGIFIDLTLYLLADLEVPNYLWQLLCCLISCAVLAFGVFLEVKAKLTYLPGEGLAMAIADTYNKEFGKVKVWVDSAMVLIGLLSAFVFLPQMEGIREGTIISALLIGLIAKFYQRKILIFDSWLKPGVDDATELN